MRENPRLNCVGFVYHWLGIKAEDEYVEPPILGRLLAHFDKVGSVQEADATAVVRSFQGCPYIMHIAIVGSDKKTILHRKGVNGKVVSEDMLSGLSEYLGNDFEIGTTYYLKLKPNKK